MRTSQKTLSFALAFVFIIIFSITTFAQDRGGSKGNGITIDNTQKNISLSGTDGGDYLSDNDSGHSTGNGLVSIDGIGDRGGGIAKSNNNGTDSGGSLTDNHRGGNGLALVTGDRVGNGIVNRGGEVVG